MEPRIHRGYNIVSKFKTVNETTHPFQPIYMDDNGTVRFKPNKIVEHLAKARLNDLSTLGFSDEDWDQFAQLIGYSVSAWGGLSYVSSENCKVGDSMVDNPAQSEIEIRIQVLGELVNMLKKTLAKPIAELYGIAVEDLTERY